MNKKDNEAFEKWHHDNVSNPPTLNDLIQKAWSDACLFKQKEIDKIKDNSLNHLIIERFMEHNEKLQTENANLINKINLALFIMKDNEWHNDEGSIQYQVYKILEKAIEEL